MIKCPVTCLYCRGADNEAELSALARYAQEHGVLNAVPLCDTPPCVTGFRRLQDYIKLGLCRTVIMPSRASLGVDRWLAVENELFLKRNGVGLVLLQRRPRDHRYDIANAVKGYFSPRYAWSSIHGDDKLRRPAAAARKSMLYGYCEAEGRCSPDEKAAGIVAGLFEKYADGAEVTELRQKLSADTEGRVNDIYRILANKRYLGCLTPSGNCLPGIISFAQWFAAEDRRRAHSHIPTNDAIPAKPYFQSFSADRPIAFYRSAHPILAEGVINIDSVLMEQKLDRLISKLANGAAERLYNDYIVPQRKLAQAALVKAEEALGLAQTDLSSLQGRLLAGERSAELQHRLTLCKQAYHTAALRVRRINTELELFSVKPLQVERFFKRARGVSKLSWEEKRIISHALIKKVVIGEETALAYCRSPLTGALVKMEL